MDNMMGMSEGGEPLEKSPEKGIPGFYKIWGGS